MNFVNYRKSVKPPKMFHVTILTEATRIDPQVTETVTTDTKNITRYKNFSVSYQVTQIHGKKYNSCV